MIAAANQPAAAQGITEERYRALYDSAFGATYAKPDDLQAVLASAHCPRLRRLELNECQLGPRGAKALADCLRQMLDPTRRTACGQAARRSAAQWTFEHHYRQMLNVFAEAAARRQAA